MLSAHLQLQEISTLEVPPTPVYVCVFHLLLALFSSLHKCNENHRLEACVCLSCLFSSLLFLLLNLVSVPGVLSSAFTSNL